jgi:hypothetical protein
LPRGLTWSVQEISTEPNLIAVSIAIFVGRLRYG